MSHLAPLMKLSCLPGGSHGVSDTPYMRPRTTQPTVELAKGGGGIYAFDVGETRAAGISGGVVSGDELLMVSRNIAT